MKIKELEVIFNCPLWANLHVNYSGSFFIKDKYHKGIRNIMDIINENGLFCDFVDLNLEII